MSSALPLRILFTGATGYIGGSVLDRLLVHPKRGNFEIVSFMRDADKAQRLEAQFGVKTVLGALADLQELEDAAAAADVVFHTANADDLSAAQAILRGMKRRHADTGKAPELIHTSGVASLIDSAKGTYSDHIRYDDTDIEQMKTIPADGMHRNVDLELLAADEEGYVNTYLVIPGSLFGLATGPLFSAGLAHSQSIILPWLIKVSATRGRAGVFGPGTNAWPWVHVADTAGLYLTLFDALLEHPQRVGHGWAGHYFVEAGELRAVDYMRAVGAALVKLGRAAPGEDVPTQYTDEEVAKYFYGIKAFGTNCHAVGARARALGWKPQYSANDCFATIPQEVERTLRLVEEKP